MSLTDAEIIALCKRWRERAEMFRLEARGSRNARHIVRLAGMSSTLEWAVNELCFAARIDQTHDVEERKP